MFNAVGWQLTLGACWRDVLAKFIALLGAFLAMKVVHFVIKRRHQHQTFKRMQVPGPKPHLIHGHLYDTRRQAYVKFAHKMHEKYGKNVGVYLGGDPYLLTKDLDLIQQVFVARSRIFYDRMNFYLNVDPVPDNLICQRGDRWRYMRRLLTPAFSNQKIRCSQFYLDCQRTVEKFMNQVEANSKTVLGADSKVHRETIVADVYDRMAAVALDVIVKTAFHMDDVILFDGQLNAEHSLGKRPQCEMACSAERVDTFLQTAKRACRLGFNPLVELIFCFPFLDGPLTFMCNHLYFGSIIRLLFQRLDHLVRRQNKPPRSSTEDKINDKSKESIGMGENKNGQKNGDGRHKLSSKQGKRIIDSLIEVLKERKITKSEFTGNAFVILFAGFETTANALTFTLWLLARDQRVQKKLRTILREQLARDGNASAGDTELELAELATGCQYLEMVINESLRLYPPVPGLSCRQASTSCQVGTMNIEKGVNVVPSVFSIHRDKTIWGERANEFEPERFEVVDVNQLNSSMFMPFGLGPRNCIGKAAALHELKILIGRLVQNYSIETCDGFTPSKLRLCSPINITITNSEPIGLKFVKINE